MSTQSITFVDPGLHLYLWVSQTELSCVADLDHMYYSVWKTAIIFFRLIEVRQCNHEHKKDKRSA